MLNAFHFGSNVIIFAAEMKRASQNKMKNIRAILSVFLLSLFTAYQVGITMFTHMHIVDGVKIVHSHPFTNGHQHTQSDYQLIAQLSFFNTLEAHSFFADFELKLSTTAQHQLHVKELLHNCSFVHPSLRAPPAQQFTI